MRANEFFYQVLQITSLTPHVSQILLTPNQMALAYVAGQYANVLHQRDQVSPLSIACAPNKQPMLEFHLYHPIENHKAQDLLRMISSENGLRLTGPFGNCTVNQLKLDQPIIFLAYGTGFAPIKAIIEEIARAKQSPPMHFYWCVANPTDLYMSALVEAWSAHFSTFVFTPVFLPELSKEIVLSDHPDLSAYQVYASGPRALIAAAFDAFQKQGLERSKFFSDAL